MFKIYVSDTETIETTVYEVVSTEQVQDEKGVGEVVVIQPVEEQQKGR